MRIGETGGPLTNGLKVLIYGPSGVGKTVWLSQWPGLFYVGAEGGTASITKKIPCVEIDSHQDLMELLAALQGYNKETSSFTLRDATYNNVKTIGVDTIDEINLREMAWALKAAGKEIPKFDEWNLSIERTRAIVWAFKQLADTKGLNIVLVSHEEYEKSDITSIVAGQPNLTGHLPTEVLKWMDINIHMIAKPGPNNTVTRSLCTQPDGVFAGKDRFWVFSKYESADGPDAGFAAWWGKLQSSLKKRGGPVSVPAQPTGGK